MGNLILCANPPAKKPYLIRPDDCPVYTLEELCYYLEQNFYLIDRRNLNRELVVWLNLEAGYPALSAELERSLYKSRSPYPCAMLLFTASGLFSGQELRRLELMFAEMKGKTALECRKMKADGYLESGQYACALREYDVLLAPENRGKMTDALRGAILHNKGVVYARMFLFPEAAECFLAAYRESENEESRKACIYALNYVDAAAQADISGDLHLNLEAMREASDKFQHISRNPANFRERKEAEAVSDAGGHVSQAKRGELLGRWKNEYLHMMKA